MRVLTRVATWFSPAARLREAKRLADAGDLARAFPLLVRAATAGIAEAEFRVGRCYLEGVGVPASRVQGARWLERAGNQGYVGSSGASGDALRLRAWPRIVAGWADPRRGQSVLRQCRRAARLCRPPRNGRAAPADGGSADGQAVLGYILTSGPEEPARCRGSAALV